MRAMGKAWRRPELSAAHPLAAWRGAGGTDHTTALAAAQPLLAVGMYDQSCRLDYTAPMPLLTWRRSWRRSTGLISGWSMILSAGHRKRRFGSTPDELATFANASFRI